MKTRGGPHLPLRTPPPPSSGKPVGTSGPAAPRRPSVPRVYIRRPWDPDRLFPLQVLRAFCRWSCKGKQIFKAFPFPLPDCLPRREVPLTPDKNGQSRWAAIQHVGAGLPPSGWRGRGPARDIWWKHLCHHVWPRCLCMHLLRGWGFDRQHR